MEASSSGSTHTTATGKPVAAGMSAAPGAPQQSSAASAAAGKWRPLSQVRGAASGGTSSSFSMLSKVAVKPRLVQAADASMAAEAASASEAWNSHGHVVSISMAQQQQHDDQELHDESVFDMLF
jgi:hypothetical protein